MQNIQVSYFKTHTGNLIPKIGFGTYQLKGQQCIHGTKWALEAGYKHIDSASIYKNGSEIGRVLKQMKIQRKQLFITSKISPSEQGYHQVFQAFNNIIRQLDCEYLDLLLIHWPGVSKLGVDNPKNSQIRLQSWKAMIQLQKKGKVRDIGVSNFLKRHLEDLAKHSEVKPAVNQFQIHPLLWQGQTIQYCKKQNILIQAYSPLARSDPKLLQNPMLIDLSKTYKKTVAQICLKWALQHGFIILPKSKSKNRIVQNFDLNFTIEENHMADINKLKKQNVRTCWDPNSIKF